MLFLLSTLFCLVTIEAMDKEMLQQTSQDKETFRAAVYEHLIIEPQMCQERVCTRQEAINAMETNLQVLAHQVEEAASQGVDILLLPEDAIHGSGFSRQTLFPFLELVPATADGSQPCFDDVDHDNFLLRNLSCLAHDQGIYLAAQMASRTPGCGHCGEEHGEECYFNTLVVFDSNGILVGVYHKYNLWTSELNTFDIDPNGPQLVTVDTPFGRLGLSVCADLIWQSPVVDLVDLAAVDTLLVPLYWWDLFPHQLAHSAEAAWARGLQVNLLAANNHNAATWTSGSGVFTSSGPAACYHDLNPQSAGRLIVADLPVHPDKSDVEWAAFAVDHLADFSDQPDKQFSAEVYYDMFTFTPIEGESGRTKVCQGEFCCLAQWNQKNDGDDTFSLGAFNGEHTADGSVRGMWWMQMCTIVKCDAASSTSCNQNQIWDLDFLTRSSTTFANLTIAATFAQGAKVFPEVLWDNAQLSGERVEVSADGRLSAVEGSPSLPMVSVSLFGRLYNEDAEQPVNFCPGQ